MKTNYQISQHEEARRRLLDAALRLVAEKGSARMTLAEVGVLAGYSRTLPAHHFGNRAGLLKALIDYVHSLLFEQLRGMPREVEGLEAVLTIARLYLRSDSSCTLAQRAVYALRLEALSGDPDITERMADFYHRCETNLERQLRLGIERGEIRPDIDPTVQTKVILGLLRGTLAQCSIDRQGSDLGPVRDEVLEILRRALAADPAPRAANIR